MHLQLLQHWFPVPTKLLKLTWQQPSDAGAGEDPEDPLIKTASIPLNSNCLQKYLIQYMDIIKSLKMRMIL